MKKIIKKNKLFDKQSLILLFSVVSICALCIISVSYAFFTTLIKGNDDATPIELVMGTMRVRFDDSNTVTLDNALPGDSITHKFRVTNTGTLAASYNIKLEIEQNDFGDKKDLVYILKKNGTEAEEHILPYTDSYILTNIEIAFEGEDNYELIVKFKEDQENKDQNDNKQKHLKFKIVVDSQTNVEESYLENNTFFMKLEDSLNLNQAAFDDFNNLRYIGATPNNYIWFNCNTYDEDMTNENANQTPYNCERWRIIGLFNNMTTVDETNEVTGTENLVKIIRDESIGKMQWAVNESNDWTNSPLKETLNNETTGYISSSYSSSSVKGITNATKGIIEKVKWNIGGSNNKEITAKNLYEQERGSTTYNNQPSIWLGYIGLMYSSDYGYATAEGTNKTRQECLNYQLSGWDSGDYQTDCAGNDWLKHSSGILWTLTPGYNYSGNVFSIHNLGHVDAYGEASNWNEVRPSLYLTSKVGIKEQVGENENSYGSENNPYILEIEQ